MKRILAFLHSHGIILKVINIGSPLTVLLTYLKNTIYAISYFFKYSIAL
jgi:hypothetical protein